MKLLYAVLCDDAIILGSPLGHIPLIAYNAYLNALSGLLIAS
jgi:hypothetical protein